LCNERHGSTDHSPAIINPIARCCDIKSARYAAIYAAAEIYTDSDRGSARFADTDHSRSRSRPIHTGENFDADNTAKSIAGASAA